VSTNKLTIYFIFLGYLGLFQTVQANVNELLEMKEKIEDVRNSLSNISEKLQKLKKMNSAEISSERVGDSSILKTSTQDELSQVQSHTLVGQDSGDVGKFNTSGFYILPFMGILASDNLAWNSSFFGEFEIDEGAGTSTGLSLGYEGKNFFSDLHLSFMQNKMKSMDLPFTLSFSGKSQGIGVHLNGGGRLHLNKFIACSIGVGVGGVDQDLSFLLSGVPFEENDFLMSYQIFTGIEYRPTESSTMGLRYRWLSIDEMDAFSSRELHLIELWLGYLF
jgi:opacity protein-like surface antigen